jgi:beta-galactosidase
MRKQKLSRRTFLQSATAATLAAKLNPASAQPTAKTEIPYPENGTLIPDDDWRLWIDEKAEWKKDPLFLPEYITIDANGVLHGNGSPLPINEPTGGWQSPSRQQRHQRNPAHHRRAAPLGQIRSW